MEIERIDTIYYNLSDKPINLIEVAFNDFLDEINTYWEVSKDDWILNYNERAYVGLLSNGLVRQHSKRFTTLQEFKVYNNDDETSVGRADLLVIDKDLPKRYYLIEAKCYDMDEEAFYKEWDAEMATRELSLIKDQARSYYIAQKSFYPKDTFLVAIMFRPVPLKNGIDIFRKKNFDPKGMKNFFFTLYYSDQELLKQKGLAVYGIIEKVE